jgi:RNA polymerase sigma factor (sigma-70 family)
VPASVAPTFSPPSLSLARRSHPADAPVPAGGVAELTRRLAAHEEEAFREFHARYFDRLYRFLLVVARGQAHEAQEALQETLLRVARHARAFDGEDAEAAFWSWLQAVARNAARDGGRRQSRYQALLERFTFRRPPEAPESADGAEARLQALLAESLAELPPEERRLVEDKYLDGVTTKALSSGTGLTEKAVESRLRRLRTRLRERLLKRLHEP